MGRFAKIRRVAQFLASEAGTSAAEFAMVIPAMLLITLGTINTGVMAFAVGALHQSVEAAARCQAVNAVNCGTTTDTTTFAQNLYHGPNMNIVYTPSVTASCSNVTATGTYHFVTGIVSLPVTITASSCYPLQPSS